MSLERDFRTLGLGPDSSWDDVKSAFRRLARKYHPDVAGPAHAKRFSEINMAYISIKEHMGDSARPSVASNHRTQEAPKKKGPSIGKRVTTKTGEIFGSVGGFFSSIINAPRQRAEERRRNAAMARERHIEESISRTEEKLGRIYARFAEFQAEEGKDTIACRLGSNHPEVVKMALAELARHKDRDFARGLVAELLGARVPSHDVVIGVLEQFSGSFSDEALARGFAKWADSYDEHDGAAIIKWIRYRSGSAELLKKFVYNESDVVRTAALHAWPPGSGLPDAAVLRQMLKSDHTELMVELLRVLRREGAPAWAMTQIRHMSTEHPEASVRVWASAIVRTERVG